MITHGRLDSDLTQPNYSTDTYIPHWAIQHGKPTTGDNDNKFHKACTRHC